MTSDSSDRAGRDELSAGDPEHGDVVSGENLCHDDAVGDARRDRPVPSGQGGTLEERRRSLAEIFGDVLPESTRDDLAGDQPDGGSRDEQFRRDVPPHHDDPHLS
jgi:hypothetical protein